MNSEIDDSKVMIDVKEISTKLAFLVGRTILFRSGSGDAAIATQVIAVKAENTIGADGSPCVEIYTPLGEQTFLNSKNFNNIMVLEPNGSIVCLGKYTDQMGICF